MDAMEIDLELRAIEKQIKDGTIEDFEGIKQKIENLKTKKAEILKERELKKMDMADISVNSYREIKDALFEKRAITLNGAGSVEVISDIFTAELETNPIKGVSVFWGANASTVIPVLAPLPARPAGTIAVDTTAAMSPKQLQPKAFYSVLPVTGEALLFLPQIEKKLPEVFATVFGDAIYNGMMAGDGTNGFKGIFAAHSKYDVFDPATAGTVTFKDLAKLALKAKAKGTGYIIVVNPDVVIGLLEENSKDPNKTEYLLNGTVLGVPVVTTTYTTGTYLAVAIKPQNYAIAIANEINIKPKYNVGDPNTYFEVVQYFAGDVIVESNVIAITA